MAKKTKVELKAELKAMIENHKEDKVLFKTSKAALKIVASDLKRAMMYSGSVGKTVIRNGIAIDKIKEQIKKAA